MYFLPNCFEKIKICISVFTELFRNISLEIFFRVLKNLEWNIIYKMSSKTLKNFECFTIFIVRNVLSCIITSRANKEKRRTEPCPVTALCMMDRAKVNFSICLSIVKNFLYKWPCSFAARKRMLLLNITLCLSWIF